MRRDRSDSRPLLHRWLAVWLAMLVVVAPIALGGNLPIIWGAYAFLFASTWIIYTATMWRTAWPRPPGEMAAEYILWFLVCCYAALQAARLPMVSDLFSPNAAGGQKIDTLAIAPGMALLVAMQWAGYGFLFVLLSQVGVRRRRATTVLSVLYAAVVLHGIFAMLQLTQWGDTLLGSPKWAYLGSATGTFVNRNSFATYLAIGLVIGVSLLPGLLEQRRKDPQALWSVGLVASGIFALVVALISTQSRMGLAAGICGAVATAVIGGVSARGFRLVILILAGVAVVAAAFYLRGEGVLERVGKTDIDLDTRTTFYAQVLAMIGARPWLGYGAGGFELAYQLFHQPPVSTDAVWDKAHSTYLGLWAELGVIAGSVPLLLVGWLGLRTVRDVLLSRTTQAPPLAGIGAIVVVALHSLVDFSLEVQGVAVTFLAVLALATARSGRTS